MCATYDEEPIKEVPRLDGVAILSTESPCLNDAIAVGAAG